MNIRFPRWVASIVIPGLPRRYVGVSGATREECVAQATDAMSREPLATLRDGPLRLPAPLPHTAEDDCDVDPITGKCWLCGQRRAP